MDRPTTFIYHHSFSFFNDVTWLSLDMLIRDFHIW